MKQEFDKLHSRLSRIEGKLDDHLERLSKNENDIHWIRGHLKIATGFVLSIITAVVAAYVKFMGDR